MQKYFNNIKCFFLCIDYKEITDYFNPLEPQEFHYSFSDEIEKIIDELFFFSTKLKLTKEETKQIAAYYYSIYDRKYYKLYPYSTSKLEYINQKTYMITLVQPFYLYPSKYNDENSKKRVNKKDNLRYSFGDISLAGYEIIDKDLRLYFEDVVIFKDGELYGRSRIKEYKFCYDCYWLIVDLRNVKNIENINITQKNYDSIEDIMILKENDQLMIIVLADDFYLAVDCDECNISIDNEPYKSEVVDYKDCLGRSEIQIHKKCPRGN